MKSYKSFLPESFIAELAEVPNDSTSPIHGGQDKGPDPTKTSASGTRELARGDQIKVIGNVDGQGAVGTVIDFPTRNGIDDPSFVVIEIKGKGKHSFHSSDVEYYDHDTDNDDEEDDAELDRMRQSIRQIRGY
jgi:hypothetical protein